MFDAAFCMDNLKPRPYFSAYKRALQGAGGNWTQLCVLAGNYKIMASSGDSILQDPDVKAGLEY